MNEPRRWVEEPEDELRGRLFRSGAGDVAPEGARNRALAALGLASTIGALGSGSASAAGSSGVWLRARWVKWTIGGGLAGLMLLGARYRSVPVVAPSADSPSVPVVTEPMLAPLAGRPAVEATRELAPDLAPVVDVAPVVPTTTKKSLASRPADTDDSLAEELHLMDRARQLLAAGNVTEASSALNEYQQRFPRGRLGPESLVLRVEVLTTRGDRSGAERLALSFLRAHPQSPYAARLRALTQLPPPGP